MLALQEFVEPRTHRYPGSASAPAFATWRKLSQNLRQKQKLTKCLDSFDGTFVLDYQAGPSLVKIHSQLFEAQLTRNHVSFESA